MGRLTYSHRHSRADSTGTLVYYMDDVPDCIRDSAARMWARHIQARRPDYTVHAMPYFGTYIIALQKH